MYVGTSLLCYALVLINFAYCTQYYVSVKDLCLAIYVLLTKIKVSALAIYKNAFAIVFSKYISCSLFVSYSYKYVPAYYCLSE